MRRHQTPKVLITFAIDQSDSGSISTIHLGFLCQCGSMTYATFYSHCLLPSLVY
jgi:hypothetical protein